MITQLDIFCYLKKKKKGAKHSLKALPLNPSLQESAIGVVCWLSFFPADRKEEN